ncbi:bile acid:sodium symporter family protein [Microbacterium neungamense]|uniref:bile acid:sodium symporter family protein n=1 Tax=Microbacterium neungamense TaxID=2810535 RepID=UPI00217ED4B2|nr:bile acid:sodium symporter family protein [Microbacterium neungamense]UWF78512.1 bile acid:sodium symporter family protein [Microbacterium neungamense]
MDTDASTLPPETTAARIGRIAGAWFPLIVLAAGAIAVFVPGPFLVLGPWITPLLMIIMLGMGMTLRASDFAIVARRPVALLIGVLAQYIVMPTTGWLLVTLLQLDPAIAVGVILVASAPGGTASNVMTYLAKGDVALSVAMTTVSTLLAPILTPLLVLFLAGSYLPVDAAGLFLSIVQIVLIPIAVGLLLRRFLPRLVDVLVEWMPLVSVVGITLVVLAVVAGSAATILASGLLIFAVVIALNGVGLLLGYGAARLAGLDEASRRAVSIEVGMQNSGLAAGLARTHFTPEAALPAAIFSVWHNVSGSLLAGFWSRRVPADARRAAAARGAG